MEQVETVVVAAAAAAAAGDGGDGTGGGGGGGGGGAADGTGGTAERGGTGGGRGGLAIRGGGGGGGGGGSAGGTGGTAESEAEEIQAAAVARRAEMEEPQQSMAFPRAPEQVAPEVAEVAVEEKAALLALDRENPIPAQTAGLAAAELAAAVG